MGRAAGLKPRPPCESVAASAVAVGRRHSRIQRGASACEAPNHADSARLGGVGWSAHGPLQSAALACREVQDGITEVANDIGSNQRLLALVGLGEVAGETV